MAHACGADWLRLAQTISATGLFDWDIGTGRIVWSEDLLRIYGVDVAGFPGTYEAWRRFVPPGDLAAVEARTKAALDRQAPSLALDFRIRRRDGALRRIECFVAFSYAADGTPLRGIGVNRDTTDEARTLRAFKETEARNRAVFDQAAVGIVEADLSGRWLRVNRRLAAMLGYDTPEALQGRSWLELTHPDDRAAGTGQLAALREGRIGHATADKRFLARDGTAVWANATVSLVRDPETGEPSFLTSVIVDASDRRRADAARAEAEERLRLAQDAAGAGLWDLDVTTGVATCSEGYCALYGLDPSSGGHHSTEEWLAQVHREDRDRARATVAASLASGDYASEYRIVRRDGAVRWLVARGRVRFDEQRRPVRFTGLLVDVTAQRENELRLRMAIEGTGLATWERAVGSGEAIWSENHFGLFGYPVEQSGRASYEMWHRRIHPDDVAAVDASVSALRDEQRFELVYRILRADDGAERWMQSVGRGVESDPGGVPSRMLGITLDVTEREISRVRLEALQAELLQVSRLADAGVMASGLAHELAQPLTAAASALQGAKLRLERMGGLPDSGRADIGEAIGLAASQVARAGEIVKGLRAFIVPHEEARRRERLRPLVEDALSLTAIGLGQAGVTMHNDVPDALPEVLADGVQIRQVLCNLVRNSVQALQEVPEGSQRGSVTITAGARGDVVEIAVIDTGPGLAPEVQGRLFEPFVTTKPDGMGIGLSICRSIIEAHGGSIIAEPNPGGGTQVRFTLPAAAGPCAEEAGADGH